ncbi:hypothetical protein VLL09_03320 [Dehalococcoides mccartyi]|uniref:Uncharacterized protein n=1 Tax=Dehalococcoides mccartyi TaxID=61435 RepID=A0AB38ZBK2_9CHLR|nr:hypothetical protein [Dehalococcoides mccartyi]WRO07932.1 hypothetical protein VLL09_03320 [Dehalococcoides mccartyi]
MQSNRIEIFQGYCPTQDKWETVEQTYIDVTTMGSEYHEYIQGLMTCPYISFRNGTCKLSKECPVIKGEWTSENPSVFVALQFNAPDGTSRDIVDAIIKPVCTEIGLNAFTVSEIEHNDGIYDVILKSISKSRFVIADLTYNNNGAYYEAGYAKGQGKKVIHACSREWFKSSGVHFDVTGLNLILYDNAEDFAEKLRKRIRETCI